MKNKFAVISSTVCIVLGAVISTASAEEVPESVLQADYDQCVIKASANKALGADVVDRYCSCVKTGIKTGLSLQQYVEMVIAWQTRQPSEHTKTLTDIAATCMSKTMS